MKDWGREYEGTDVIKDGEILEGRETGTVGIETLDILEKILESIYGQINLN